jgi:glucosylceramidase
VRVALALIVAVAGCAHAPGRAVADAPGTVDVYVTTADRSKLLAREPSIAWASDTVGTPIIDVDDAQRFQSMVGFGAALTDASAWLITHRLSASGRDSLLRELFGAEPGVSFSFVRVDMGASDFSLHHYSYDDMPAGQRDSALMHFSIDPDRTETIPILRDALRLNPQLTVMASPWSAPGWMKTTDSMIKGTLRADAYEPFARYFVRFIRDYAAAGVPISLITVQNEPHFEPDNYPGMRLEPPARARFVAQYLGPALAHAGVHTRVLDWDHNWNEPDSPLRVLADSSARPYIAGIAWHCYGGDVSAQSQVHDAYPDKDTYFTECSGGRWAPNFGENLLWMTRTLIIGSTRNWARGVLMWNLALDEHDGPHTGGCGNCRGVVTIDSASGRVTRNEEYYAFGHASRFVHAGASRVQSTSVANVLETVAFRNTDGSMALIVANPASNPVTFTVRVHARAFHATLPAAAVATFRWR